ncbi:MAG: type II toxin-antitoxin system mRNA interferase toxin, RelE/StbE family [Candidatus Magasanikbacteria bacterium]|nr:type II toxin-antitoxin system mRNA interferase toxin, RelE/StbE family [Candidatus Magasanikbacteria bacterium]
MEVKFHKNFKKRFKKIPVKIQEQFYQRLEVFLTDKFDKTLNNHSVGKAFPDCKSINVSGDYRAIFQEQGDVAIFLTVGTHSELY